MTKPQLTNYDPQWQALATDFQATLTTLPGFKVSSHVGSTAMPQGLAQPMIDIAVLVADVETAANALNATLVSATTYQLTWHEQPFHVILTTDDAAYQTMINFRDYLNAHRTDNRKYTVVRQSNQAAAKADFISGINDKATEWLTTKDQHEHHDRTVRAELVNMCLIRNPETNEVVVENKIDAKWTGLTFPGGHVDPGESQVHAMKREVLEETGLTVNHLQLVGTVTWVENAAGDVSLGTLYTTTDYSGDLLPGSYEGAISWLPLSSLTPDKLAPGIAEILQVFTQPTINEAFWGNADNQLQLY
ncbi:GrpB family protein [Lactiplantibacillus mudanjiangensis]|uniref:Phosphohydrolase [Lactobacillus sp.] n=1 Tax=Lactiplantibacillus mudanjiangensis TaxID=1296538 RepID=A0A660E4P7_9LACO|nr:GrpB family protein [Lactiplantibacillus mudanjiangensis]VDG25494.1 phosphohydrolase [Lactobacillus sp.] [Lactiplantibacillus mudanjiangensis]VDG27918.1 phosphohydrolase [Lactobacillus sp.] [Lactiplantibacillus mudanjiangensis]